MRVGNEIGTGDVLAERFRVHGRLGSGGTATVFLAEDCVLGRDVAIKRLDAEGSEEDIRRFRREARLGASLMHPNLVTIFDTLSSDDGVFIVMEYVRGRPFSDLVAPGGMDPRRALEVLRPVASALDYAHERGVVHRDVKPANVLISEARVVKLVDLGTATAGHMTQITAENEVMGTLAYIAPERLAGESVGEPAADVYSLAVTAFEALTGRPPHRAETPAELLEKVRHGPPPDVTEAWLEVPPPLRSVLAHGLDPDPDRRQASAGAMVRDLEAALGRPSGAPHVFQPTQPMPTVPPQEEPASRPFVPPPVAEHRRRRWLLPALAVLAAMVAAGVWVALSAGGSDGGNRNGSGQADNGRGAKQTSTASGAATPTASNSSDATETGTLGAGPSTPAAQPTGSSPEVGAQLNEQGYELIQQGRYAEAVPVLRRAVASFPRETADINYAYALFNLGHALRMAGRPETAIPILEQRLQIPDQTQTVQAELGAARAEAGE